MFMQLKGVGEKTGLKMSSLVTAYVKVGLSKHMKRMSSGPIDNQGST